MANVMWRGRRATHATGTLTNATPIPTAGSSRKGSRPELPMPMWLARIASAYAPSPKKAT